MTTITAKRRHYLTEEENEIQDSQNPRYLFCGISTSILSAIAKGEIDANELAKKELSNRGLNEEGLWIGFQKR